MAELRQRKADKIEGGIIQAAGGIVWRPSTRGQQVAVVHRPRYDDWTLPKGWLEPGESWPEAALREVREETHCEVSLDEFAGCACYVLSGVPKVVLFWHMVLLAEHPFVAHEETDALAWLTPAEARQRLSYEGERRLMARPSRDRPRHLLAGRVQDVIDDDSQSHVDV